MKVDRETGEIKPTYSFGELMILCKRVDCEEGLNLLIDLFEDEYHLYAIPLRGHILREFMACERRLNSKMNRK